MECQDIKKMLKRIFFLPPMPTLLISVPAYGLVIYALADEKVNPIISYSSYLLSAYALILTMTGITGIIRWVQRGIKEHPLVRKLLGIPLVGRYMREDAFRAELSLYQGFCINLLYAGVKIFTGICCRSIWFITLAVYYIFLALMRFSLLSQGSGFLFSVHFHHIRTEEVTGENRVSQWKRYRLCGIILLFMNVALAGIVCLAVYQNNGFIYPGMLIYIMAMYTFYAAVTAIWNVIKFRRYGNPVLSAAKAVNLTAAMVSMLSLETAMLTQFGTGDDAGFRQIMTASTGAGVSVIVLGMAVYMIVHATKCLNTAPREKVSANRKGDGLYDSYTGS